MSASFYDLLKYAKTGIASPSMTEYDKLKALAMCKAGFPVKTLTGVPPISFKSDGTPLTAWSISGNMVQTGTPTQTVPITPEECGERTGNAMPVTSFTGKSNTVLNDFNSATANITFQHNTQYTINYDFSSGMQTGIFKLTFTYSDETTSSSNWIYGTVHRTFTSDAGKTVTGLTLTNYAQYVDVEMKNIMLNTGSTALPYEPFGYKLPISNGNTTYNVYLSEPLRKIGDYGDTVSSDGTVVRRIKKLVLTGEETWNGPYEFTDITRFELPLDSGCTNLGGICTHYPWKVQSGGTTEHFYTNNTRLCYIFSTSISTLADFKQFLRDEYTAGHPVEVWYVLANPVTETVTAPTITPTKGANTLSIGTTLQPSVVSITGRIKQA